jgi:endonuclease/exonuclease/phosphatase family metal-dependent hydrolase
MRVGTFNIMHGRSLVDGRVDPDRLRAAVAALDVDVLGMQEVDRDQPRSAGADLTAAAGEGMGAREARFVASVVGVPGVAWRAALDEEDGAGSPRYGVALLSRWPVRSWHLLRLPSAPVRSPVYVPGPGRSRLILLRDEPRVVVAAVVEAPSGPVTVANVHLSFVPGWNAVQLRRAVGWLRTLPGPRLLMGDFNLPRPVVSALSRWRVAAPAATFPAPAPRLHIDHVLLDPRDAGALVWAGAPVTPVPAVSDHRPLVATLRSGPGRHPPAGA